MKEIRRFSLGLVNEERPQCVVCLKVLACDSLKRENLLMYQRGPSPESLGTTAIEYWNAKRHISYFLYMQIVPSFKAVNLL